MRACPRPGFRLGPLAGTAIGIVTSGGMQTKPERVTREEGVRRRPAVVERPPERGGARTSAGWWPED